jgi:hypothetical protein
VLSSPPGRINKFKGQILAHAVPLEVLGRTGRQVPFPKNNSDTYVARRWLPYGATATSASRRTSSSRTAPATAATSSSRPTRSRKASRRRPDSIVPLDITVVMQQYGCLYGFTDKTYNLYEDDIPKAMIEQVGERVDLVNEMIIYGALRACTNQYFGGTGTTIATVNGAITLGLVRKIAKNLQANHGKPVNKVLKAVGQLRHRRGGGRLHGLLPHRPRARHPRPAELHPAEKYASGTPMPNEIGKCERFRFITSPDLPSIQDGGAAVGATGLLLDLRHQHRRLPVHRRGPGRLGPGRGARQGQPRPDLPAAGREVQVRPARPARLCRHDLVEGRDDREPGLDGRRLRRLEDPHLNITATKFNVVCFFVDSAAW